MSTINLTCPQCGQLDSVRKVSTIVSDGTSSGTFSGYGGGIGYSDHGMTVMDEVITISSSSQNQLSRLLSPPIKPPEYYFDGMLIFVSLGLIGLFISIFGLFNILNSQFDIGIFFLIIGSTWLGVFAWIAVRSPHQSKNMKIQTEIGFLAWKKAINRWRLLYYCYRCDGVYLPNLNYIVPAQYIIGFLYYE